MNKTEMIEIVAKETGLLKPDVDKVIKSLAANIIASVAKGGTFALIGFGTFSAHKRTARTGRNPATGKTITIPAAMLPKFKAGKHFKEALNKKKPVRKSARAKK